MSAIVDRVEAARADKDHRTALSLALGEWRKTRDASIARAIDALSAESHGFEPPKARTNKDFQVAWLETLASNNPLAVPWLAEQLARRMPRDEPDSIFVARLQAMRESPDPRFAAALMAMIVEGKDIVRWCREELEATLAIVGDVRSREGLEAIIAMDDDSGWQDVLARLPKTQPVSDEMRERWEAVAGKGKSASKRDVPALMAAVLDDPDDIGARAVLADALQEAGDPRGELIMLQLLELDGRGAEDTTRRADELIGKHLKKWLGPIHPIVYRGQFRGGFLEELELESSRRAPMKAWEKHARDPSLATVRKVTPGRAPAAIMALFVGSPALRSLAFVSIDSNPVATALETTVPQRVREARCLDWSRGRYDKAFVERVLPLLDAMPALESVACQEPVLEALMKSPVFERLSGLSVCSDVDSDEVRERLVALPANITSLEILWADAEDVLPLLDKLPPHITRVQVKDNAVIERTGDKRTLRVQVRSHLELDPRRHPSGLPDLLPLAQELEGLVAVEVETFTDKADLSGFDPSRWKKGTTVNVHRVFESGLTRKFADN